jgi:hypothetical protein
MGTARRKVVLFIVIFLTGMISSIAYGSEQSSSNYTIEKYVITGAGGQSNSDNYSLSHILSQSSPLSSSSSTNYRIYSGFRHAGSAITAQPDGDVAPLGSRDGMVNVGDALVALRFALGLETPTSEDTIHGDVAPLDVENKPNPDGVINVGDALVILRKALGIIDF